MNILEQTSEEPVHLPKKPLFGIESDPNDMNQDPLSEKRIVPKQREIEITDPSPAGE